MRNLKPHIGIVGCGGVVLGCTEIPLIVDAGMACLPTFDSTRLLARAALDWANDLTY